jgi:diguanylate cyclase (GGDEF)-like protein/PAS domain S-box-containing protein
MQSKDSTLKDCIVPNTFKNNKYNIDISFFKNNKQEIIQLWNSNEKTQTLLNRFSIDQEHFVNNIASKVVEYFIGVLQGKNSINNCPIMRDMITLFYEKGFSVEDVFAMCSGFKNSISFFMFEKKVDTKTVEIFFDLLDTNLQSTLKIYSDKVLYQNKLLQLQKNIIEDHVLLTITDIRGKIVHATDAFCKLSGFKKEELIGKSHKLIKDSSLPKAYYKDLWDTIKKGKTWESKVRNIAKDGSLFIVNTKIVPVKDLDDRIIQYMAIREDITAKENAKYDSLTNLYNRKQFDDIFFQLFEESKHNDTELSLVIVDADHFKRVNDNYGHQKGDEVLVEISKILTQNIRGNDLCARWGGEEFVVLLPGSNTCIAQKIANRMRESIQKNIIIDKQAQTCSFGIANINKNDTIETMFKRADEALYSAKATGRNKVVYFEDESEKL